ncbi:hypothetical protein EES43_16755 [Streptomyces sp. ADI96-02]|nr:hypothetical protein EES43_16755 [Streptomyces sp. ADI96-02]
MAVRDAAGQGAKTVAIGATVRNMRFTQFDGNQSKQVRKLIGENPEPFDLCGEKEWLPSGIHLCNSPDNPECMQGRHECEGVLDVYEGSSDVDIVACQTSDEKAPVDYGGGTTRDEIRTSQTFLDGNRLCDLLKKERRSGRQFDGEFGKEFDALPEDQQAFFMMAEDDIKYWWYLRDLWQNTGEFGDAGLLLHRLGQLKENYRSVYEDLLYDWLMSSIAINIVPMYEAERAMRGNFYDGISSDIARVLMDKGDDDPYLQAACSDMGYAEWFAFLRIYLDTGGNFAAGTTLDDYLNEQWIPRADLALMTWLGDDDSVIDAVTGRTMLRMLMRKSLLENDSNSAISSYNDGEDTDRAFVWLDGWLAEFLTDRGIQRPEAV